MASSSQILANRKNSKKSTGPKTEEGKSASSSNAISHGFNAADPVLPTEDRDRFNQLLAQYESDLAPDTVHQEFLVSQMAGARWKLNRLEHMETEMFSKLEDPTRAFTDQETSAGFAKLERYRAALERTYQRCARELRDDKKARAQIQNEAKSSQAAEDRFMGLLARLYEGPSDGYLRMILAEHRAKQAAAQAPNAASE